MVDVIVLNEFNALELLELEKLCFSHPWTLNMFLGDLKSENTIYIGAYVNCELVGYFGLWKIGVTGEITNIAVHPKYRNRGIAKTMMNKIVDFCYDEGIIYLNLDVRESNEAAICLYKKFDFEKVGLRKNYYKEPNENAILMTKKIAERID